MPTVPPETEALHFFRALQALIFSVVGTVMVVLSASALTVNYLWTTLAAIGGIFVIVPAMLAMRRARRNRPGEPTEAFRALRRQFAILNIVGGIALIAAAALLARGNPNMQAHILVVVLAVFVVASGFVLRFVPFYVVAAVILIAAIAPFRAHLVSNDPAVAGLVAGLALWIGAFLVFSRTSQ